VAGTTPGSTCDIHGSLLGFAALGCERCYARDRVRHLQAVGNSSGIIIDKPILELLRITPDTKLDISTDGERLIITPIRQQATPKNRLAQAQARTLANHGGTFRKLSK
jgi:antitoxin component of MazEF toxin-antitoxin module